MGRPAFRDEWVQVRTPATSANLGPGFDAVALALALYDDVEVRVVATGLVVEVAGQGAGSVPRDESNLLVHSLRRAFADLGDQPPGLHVRCSNGVPQGRGLGSSAGTIVAGILAARELVPGGDAALSTADVLRLASSIEGHADNVAACLYGGLTIAWLDDDGARCVAVATAPSLRVIAFVPDQTSSTKVSRGLLPAAVPHADAAANSGRAALLIEALSRRPELLLAATEDWLHQRYRAAAVPRSAELVARLRAAGVAAVLSGSGPTVVALSPSAPGAALLAGEGWHALDLAVDTVGAQVLRSD